MYNYLCKIIFENKKETNNMKIFISADMEGVAGVTTWESTRYGGQGYEEACRLMTREVAAACEAVTGSGGQAVVKDGHEDAVNIDIEALPEGTRLIRGWMTSPEGMMGGLDETFDGVIYIGYHSPAGMNTSPLTHTVEYSWFNWVKLNGRLASEFSLNAVYADSLGVPSLFISGDSGICRHAGELYKDIATVSTKECTGNATCSIHPDEAVKMIKEGVKKAVSRIKKPAPRDGRMLLEMNFKDHQKAKAASYYPGAVLSDCNTVTYTAENVKDFMIAKMFMFEI